MGVPEEPSPPARAETPLGSIEINTKEKTTNTNHANFFIFLFLSYTKSDYISITTHNITAPLSGLYDAIVTIGFYSAIETVFRPAERRLDKKGDGSIFQENRTVPFYGPRRLGRRIQRRFELAYQEAAQDDRRWPRPVRGLTGPCHSTFEQGAAFML